MTWLELRVDITSEAIDWVRTLLPTAGYDGMMQVSPYEPLPTSDSPWEWTVRSYLPDSLSSHRQCSDIEQRLSALHRTGLTTELQTRMVADLPKHEPPTPHHRIAERFVISASPVSHSSTASNSNHEIPIQLQNSLAFGSGLHPTTILCLTLINRYILPTMNVLDLGSGSGILSIAMAKLGATVLALDNDAIAVEATRQASFDNDVADRVTATVGSLGEGSDFGHWMGGTLSEPVSSISSEGQFDVVVANVPSHLHMAIAPEYPRALRHTGDRSGILITAGFTSDAEADVTEHITHEGFKVIDCERYDEWVAFAYQLIAKP